MSCIWQRFKKNAGTENSVQARVGLRGQQADSIGLLR
jgi:hypothetical protein